MSKIINCFSENFRFIYLSYKKRIKFTYSNFKKKIYRKEWHFCSGAFDSQTENYFLLNRGFNGEEYYYTDERLRLIVIIKLKITYEEI